MMAKELVNESQVRSDAFGPKLDAVKKAVRSISEELRDLYIIDAKSDEYKGERLINADINGACNIGRKYSDAVFSGVKDFSNLYGKVNVVCFENFYLSKKDKIVENKLAQAAQK